VINLEEIGNAINRSVQIGEHPTLAVEEMLRRVIRSIPDERLWVDDEPRLSP
jgi:hypothetical protein